jgi:hypothetical protein
LEAALWAVPVLDDAEATILARQIVADNGG